MSSLNYCNNVFTVLLLGSTRLVSETKTIEYWQNVQEQQVPI